MRAIGARLRGRIAALPQTIRAGVWMSGTICSFTLMAIAGREASRELDVFEVLAYRSAAGVFIVVCMAAVTGRLHQIAFRAMRLHASRNLVHFAATCCWLYAVASIPLAQVFAFEFSSPIWAAVLAPFLLQERLTAGRALVLAIGFLGILVVAQPGIVELVPGTYAAILCAAGFGASAVITRRLVRHVDVISVLFWMSAMQAVFALALAGYDGDFTLPSPATVLPLAVIAVAGITAHYSLTSALKLAPAAVVMPFDFVRLPVIMVVGYLAYSEGVDAFLVAGGTIILLANYLSIRNESRQDLQR